MSDELKPCPSCKREWPKDCEQAIAVEIYGECAYCHRFQDVDFEKIVRIQTERDYLGHQSKE